MKVVPSTNGDDPMLGAASLAAGTGNEVDVSIDTSGVLAAKLPAGLDPKRVDDPLVLPPKALNPPLLAKLANPPDDGDVVAPLPNILPVDGLELAKPDWPNAAAAAPVDPEAQGEAFIPILMVED